MHVTNMIINYAGRVIAASLWVVAPECVQLIYFVFSQELTEIATLKIFPFASALQTMCVVAMDTVTRKTYALAKGSPEKISKLSKKDTGNENNMNPSPSPLLHVY